MNTQLTFKKNPAHLKQANEKAPLQNRNPHNMLCSPLGISRNLLVTLKSNISVLFIDNEVSKEAHTEVISGCFPACFRLVL